MCLYLENGIFRKNFQILNPSHTTLKRFYSLQNTLLMALKKDFKFEPMLAQSANFHFALSHPARLQIIYRLRTQGQLSFDQLAVKIPLHPSTVSQHLLILRRTDLIIPVELNDGQQLGYRLNPHTYEQLEASIMQFF